MITPETLKIKKGIKWGDTWTADDINDAGFGYSIQVSIKGAISGANYAYLDGMKMTVYYNTSGGGLVQYFNNPTLANSSAATSVAGDPTNGMRSVVYQAYIEMDPYANAIASIPAGSDGLWDFSLTTSSMASGKSYCFRTVKADGSLLDSYTNIPEISVISTAGAPLDQQLRGGQSVTNGTKNPFSW